VVYGEDTATLCNRNPDLLQFEFAPYSTNASTAALKKLWRKNCECKPERGVWANEFVYETFYVDSSFPNGRRSRFTVSGGMTGPFVGMRLVIIQTARTANAEWYGYSSSDNYQAEKLLQTRGIAGVPNPTITSSFSQKKITSGCYAAGVPLPAQPTGIASPWVASTPFVVPPPDFYIPEVPPKRRSLPPPAPEECCDCC
jgi:hypothetical protein